MEEVEETVDDLPEEEEESSDEMIVVGLEIEPEPSHDKVVEEVLAGKWGVGQEKRLRLAQAGYNVREIEAEVVRRSNSS